MVPPNVLDGLPDNLRNEATAARKKQQDERNEAMKKLRPPLSDLLNPDQVRIAQRGTKDERAALFLSLDPNKRERVVSALHPGNLADFPELRRLTPARAIPAR